MPTLCVRCEKSNAAIQRPSTKDPMCKECFFQVFEDEVHDVIMTYKMFTRGERVAIAVSGGKDSTVLANVMTTLNRRYDYGLDLWLCAIDEGIKGYRDDSLETVKRNEIEYGIPLRIASYKDLYGWTMDEIVAATGKKNNCTFCGVFRRQALDRAARTMVEADKICTGHNADDCAETVLMNILRGDISRLGRCADPITGTGSPMPRCKPLMFAFEKEIVMYAHYKKLDYFSTECIYSPNAYRGKARELIKELERVNPQTLLDIIHSAQHIEIRADGTTNVVKKPIGSCERCGYMSSNTLCKACVLLEGLRKGQSNLATSNMRKQKRLHAIQEKSD
eukprot:GDKJ01042966.1.p1 GENE.GDKJ01042966.1~~GDKJ01042966.1.p1  ORF type:complete len:335 (-),score=53.02 GDKJ01042966.1:93-1097(-)